MPAKQRYLLMVSMDVSPEKETLFIILSIDETFHGFVFGYYFVTKSFHKCFYIFKITHFFPPSI